MNNDSHSAKAIYDFSIGRFVEDERFLEEELWKKGLMGRLIINKDIRIEEMRDPMDLCLSFYRNMEFEPLQNPVNSYKSYEESFEKFMDLDLHHFTFGDPDRND